MTESTALAGARQGLARILADIETAGRALDAGEPVRLAGLTSAVAAACAGATALPAAEARTLLPEMERAIAALGKLAARLEVRAGTARQEPPDAQRLHAARAYGKAIR
jgi:histidinol-phosphate/aromatic aminotransferase/cobyric acid decarboxylase-like protein